MTNAPSTRAREYRVEEHDLFIRLELHCWASGLLGKFCTLPSGLWDRLTTTLETLEPTEDLLSWTSICFLVVLMRVGASEQDEEWKRNGREFTQLYISRIDFSRIPVWKWELLHINHSLFRRTILNVTFTFFNASVLFSSLVMINQWFFKGCPYI